MGNAQGTPPVHPALVRSQGRASVTMVPSPPMSRRSQDRKARRMEQASREFDETNTVVSSGPAQAAETLFDSLARQEYVNDHWREVGFTDDEEDTACFIDVVMDPPSSFTTVDLAEEEMNDGDEELDLETSSSGVDVLLDFGGLHTVPKLPKHIKGFEVVFSRMHKGERIKDTSIDLSQNTPFELAPFVSTMKTNYGDRISILIRYTKPKINPEVLIDLIAPGRFVYILFCKEVKVYGRSTPFYNRVVVLSNSGGSPDVFDVYIQDSDMVWIADKKVGTVEEEMPAHAQPRNLILKGILKVTNFE